jgi:hypothetical protein
MNVNNNEKNRDTAEKLGRAANVEGVKTGPNGMWHGRLFNACKSASRQAMPLNDWF